MGVGEGYNMEWRITNQWPRLWEHSQIYLEALHMRFHFIHMCFIQYLHTHRIGGNYESLIIQFACILMSILFYLLPI